MAGVGIGTPLDPIEPIGPGIVPVGSRFGLLRRPQFLVLMMRNPKAVFGMALLAFIVLVSIAAPLIASHPPSEADELPAQAPSARYPFGTTDQGYNDFSWVVYGGRMSLLVAGSASVIAMLIAITLGLLAAYRGSWIDDVINLVTNVFLVIPVLPLLLVISSFLPSTGPVVMAFIIGLTSWALETRILRGQALTLRNRDFILAARVAGESTIRIVFGEFFPNMLSRIAAGFAFVFVQAIFYEAALEFLGFGDANKVSWGTALFWASNNSSLLTGHWWNFVFPGFAISLTILAIVFINYGIDELSNPRLRRSGARRRRLLTGLLWPRSAAT
jgi:peptide/nickel transport system permease protein